MVVNHTVPGYHSIYHKSYDLNLSNFSNPLNLLKNSKPTTYPSFAVTKSSLFNTTIKSKQQWKLFILFWVTVPVFIFLNLCLWLLSACCHWQLKKQNALSFHNPSFNQNVFCSKSNKVHSVIDKQIKPVKCLAVIH